MTTNLLKAYNFAKFQRCFLIKHAGDGSKEEEGIAFTIKVNNKCLKSWYDLTTKRGPEQGEVKYVDIINRFLAERHVTSLREKCVRIEENARALSCIAKSNLSGKRGRQYTVCANLFRRINVMRCDLIPDQDLNETRKTVDQLRAQRAQLSEQYEQLYESLNTLNDLKCKSEEKWEEQVIRNAELEQTNKQLLELVTKLETLHGNDLDKRRKTFSEVGRRQQHRILMELKTKAEGSLWFAKAFGLDVSSVKFEDETGLHHEIKYSSSTRENTSKSYEELSDDEKDVIKQVTFITDRFCIGEAAYHELTMGESGSDLPRSYLIKQCKHDLNKLVKISRTPGQAEGAQLDFESEMAGVLTNKVGLFTLFTDS